MKKLEPGWYWVYDQDEAYWEIGTVHPHGTVSVRGRTSYQDSLPLCYEFFGPIPSPEHCGSGACFNLDGNHVSFPRVRPTPPNLPQGEPQPAPTTKELADRMDALEAKLAAVFERHDGRVFWERLQQSFDHEGGRG